MKVRVASLLSITLLAGAVLAQGSRISETSPTADQILDKYLQAIGGAPAWQKLTSRVMKMSMEVPQAGVAINIESYAEAPNKRVQLTRVIADEHTIEISRGFNGKDAWSLNLTEGGGFRKLTGTELATEKRDAEFYHELELKKLYSKITVLGTEEVDNHTTWCVEAVPDKGHAEKWYFDTETGLLQRIDYWYERVTGGLILEEAHYEDYRDVDGVKLPFTIRSPRNNSVITVKEVKHNVRIEDSRFKNPGEAFDTLSRFKVRRAGEQPVERGVLYLDLSGQSSSDQISVRADLDGINRTYVLPGRADEITRSLRTLHILLQKEEGTKEGLTPLLEEFGGVLFNPISSLLDSASEVRFIIPGEFLTFPFDLLHFKGSPLFLKKPVTYSFERLATPQFQFSPPRTAMIIEDEAINPEKCCRILQDVLPSSHYYNMEGMNLARLSSLDAANVVLISTHGYVGYTLQDYMQIAGERLLPEHLARFSPEMVYLDSCALGASASFIESFRELGTKYYLAPLVSNEAGNSSTKTIAFFFERLKAGDSPARAMFYTRKKLYDLYGEKRGYAKLLFRAFPFRVYVLN